MALRDENRYFTRRIADRGSDEIVFDSQDRKIQETDPMDFIRDEVVGKEEHPEDGGGYKFRETDSTAFIWDENDGKEEYPEDCSDIYLSPPCFDNYGDEVVSYKDFWWVTQAMNVVVVQEETTVHGEITGDSPECAKISTGNLNPFVQGEKTDIISGVDDLVPLVEKGNLVPKSTANNMEEISYEFQQYLVFEYMPNKSFDCFNAKLMDCSFSLTTFIPLIHRDGKTHVISLQSIGTNGYGGYGYIDPQYMVFPCNESCFIGGTGFERDELAHKVKLLRSVMTIIINQNRVDVPFDPGGFGPEAKLEDEFFRRGRE